MPDLPAPDFFATLPPASRALASRALTPALDAEDLDARLADRLVFLAAHAGSAELRVLSAELEPLVEDLANHARGLEILAAHTAQTLRTVMAALGGPDRSAGQVKAALALLAPVWAAYAPLAARCPAPLLAEPAP